MINNKIIEYNKTHEIPWVNVEEMIFNCDNNVKQQCTNEFHWPDIEDYPEGIALRKHQGKCPNHYPGGMKEYIKKSIFLHDAVFASWEKSRKNYAVNSHK